MIPPCASCAVPPSLTGGGKRRTTTVGGRKVCKCGCDKKKKEGAKMGKAGKNLFQKEQGRGKRTGNKDGGKRTGEKARGKTGNKIK